MKLSITNKSQIKTDIAGYCFVSLVVIGVVVFTFIPAIQSLVYSFFNYDGFLKMEFAGFDNFLYMFQQDYEIGKVFANTFTGDFGFPRVVLSSCDYPRRCGRSSLEGHFFSRLRNIQSDHRRIRVTFHVF